MKRDLTSRTKGKDIPRRRNSIIKEWRDGKTWHIKGNEGVVWK
jgi:hypothetical protein